MTGGDEDDKPTVILDLNALKKQKLKVEEDMANIASELEFNVGESQPEAAAGSATDVTKTKATFSVILFDFGSDFFQTSLTQFPSNYDYKILKTLPELNTTLHSKDFQIVVFNYDVNPKAINQLCAQIKQKFSTTKTMIMAKNISPDKARAHAKTTSGASGYYQFPIVASKVEKEFQNIYSQVKK